MIPSVSKEGCEEEAGWATDQQISRLTRKAGREHNNKIEWIFHENKDVDIAIIPFAIDKNEGDVTHI